MAAQQTAFGAYQAIENIEVEASFQGQAPVTKASKSCCSVA